jgi:CDP-glucose 4,6-dehydratase
MNPTFWLGRRVLVTGHTGFKGSWLSLWLQSLGAKVLGYALEPPTQPNLFNLASVASGITSVLGDVCDGEHLRQVVKDFKPGIVFHMAAQAIVRESYNKPVETYATNVMGTVHLLDAVRHAGNVRAVLIITSDKCYENREWVWGYREYEAMGGFDPYSSSKGCAEIVTSSYRNSFFNRQRYSEHRVAIASARAGNVIGGGDWGKYRLIPDILRALIIGETVIIRNPRAIRPWQHVLDPLNGYLTLAERLYEDGEKYCEAWNFGPYESGVKPVSWVVDQLHNLWGDSRSWKLDKAHQPHEDNYLFLDCAKARHQLGWEPKLDLKTALEWIVNWTKAHQAGEDMRTVTHRQIGNFMNLAQERETAVEYDLAQDGARQAPSWQEQEQLFDLIHETAMSRSLDGTIKFWSKGAEEMYGWKKEEAIGQVSHTLLKTQFAVPLEQIESKLSREGLWEGNLMHAKRDGTRIVVKSRWVMQGRNTHPRGTVLEVNHILIGKVNNDLLP